MPESRSWIRRLFCASIRGARSEERGSEERPPPVWRRVTDGGLFSRNSD
jgi:hypothetical protein